MIDDGGLLGDIAVTVSQLVIGVVSGLVVGLVVALLFYHCAIMEKIFTPLIVVAQITPKIALAPLFVLWFGLGLASKVWLVALVTFFPVLVNSLSGLRSIPTQVNELAQLVGLTGVRKFFQIQLPSLRLQIINGVQLGALAGITAAVIGEMIGARYGLGYVIVRGQESADTAQVMVSLFILSFLGLITWHGFAWISQKLPQ